MYTILSRVLYGEDDSIGKYLKDLAHKHKTYLDNQENQQAALDSISHSLSIIADHIGKLVQPDNSEEAAPYSDERDSDDEDSQVSGPQS